MVAILLVAAVLLGILVMFLASTLMTAIAFVAKFVIACAGGYLLYKWLEESQEQYIAIGLGAGFLILMWLLNPYALCGTCAWWNLVCWGKQAICTQVVNGLLMCGAVYLGGKVLKDIMDEG